MPWLLVPGSCPWVGLRSKSRTQRQSIRLKLLKVTISLQPLSRKHSYLNHGYFRKSAFVPWLVAPVHASGWSLRSKSGTLLKCDFYKCVVEQTYTDSLSDMAPPFDSALWVMKWRSSCVPYFTVQCFRLISWRQFDVLTWYFWMKKTVWPDARPQNKSDLYYMVTLFCLISWRLFDVWKW